MIPDNTILVSFDIVNMYQISPSTDCIIAGLEICLKCNNSRFGSQNLLQLNEPATGAPNSCSYADLDVFNIDKNVLQAKEKFNKKLDIFVDIVMIV